MVKLIYLNGKFVPEEEARIPVTDRGFMYGDGVFETMRAYNGKVFRLESHLERLERGLRVLVCNNIPDFTVLEAAVNETINRNNLTEARIKLIVTRGESDTLAPTSSSPTVVITAVPISSPSGDASYSTVVVDCIRRDENSLLSRIKSLNYLPSILGLMEAKSKGADEGIMLNNCSNVAEGTISNIFLVSGGVLVTPRIEDGALPGTTRAVVLKIAHNISIPVEERSVGYDELASADEVFATNSIIEVKPVISVDSRPIGNGHPGAITQMLAESYKKVRNR